MSATPGRTISLVAIQNANLAMLSALRDEVVRLFDSHADGDTLATQTLQQLFRYMSERSQTVSFLVSREYAWDAEIILRSFYEAAAKIVFICKAQPSEKEALAKEFWDAVGLAGDRRRARKAEFAEAVLKGDPSSARIFEHLRRPGALRDAESPGNRAARKAIDKKWSFSEIVETLEGELPGAKSLLHMYGMASHLIHADAGALELMIDRTLRQPEELQLLRASHACRILSDLASLWYLCAACLAGHLGVKFSEGKELGKQLRECLDMSEPLHRLFAESQNDFYERELGDPDAPEVP
ncbi:MAG TPA: DUF5677 domain-containing protein [Rhizomicrobium sp.]|jgi:hypothetical protein